MNNNRNAKGKQPRSPSTDGQSECHQARENAFDDNSTSSPSENFDEFAIDADGEGIAADGAVDRDLKGSDDEFAQDYDSEAAPSEENSDGVQPEGAPTSPEFGDESQEAEMFQQIHAQRESPNHSSTDRAARISDIARILICRPDILQVACRMIDPNHLQGFYDLEVVVIITVGNLTAREGGSIEDLTRDKFPSILKRLRRSFVESFDGRYVKVIDAMLAPGGLLETTTVEDLLPEEQWQIAKWYLLKRAFDEMGRAAENLLKDSDECLSELHDRIEEIQALGRGSCETNAQTDLHNERIPFPVHLLPPRVVLFVQETAASKICDPGMVALPVLATLAACIGTTRQIALKDDWLEYPIIWAAPVAESGTRKSPAFEAVASPLKKAQQVLHADFESKMQLYSANLRAWERKADPGDDDDENVSRGRPPQQPRYHHIMTTDTTVEAVTKILSTADRGVIILKDELSDFVGNLNAYKRNSNDVAKYLEWYQGHTSKTDRKTSDPTCIERAAVWITGTIQPATFWRCFGDAYAENGFLARFLLCLCDRIPQGWSDQTVSPETTACWQAILDGLRSLEFHQEMSEDEFGHRRVPVVIRMTPKAQAKFKEFCHRHAAELHAEADESIRAAWSKMTGYAAKFALVDHLVGRLDLGGETGASENSGQHCGDQDLIGVESVERAIGLADWFKYEAKRIYGMKVEMSSHSEQDQRNLIAFIRRRGGKVTARDVAGNFRRFHKSSKLAKEELEGLVEQKLGRFEKRFHGKGGQHTEQFALRKDA